MTTGTPAPIISTITPASAPPPSHPGPEAAPIPSTPGELSFAPAPAGHSVGKPLNIRIGDMLAQMTSGACYEYEPDGKLKMVMKDGKSKASLSDVGTRVRDMLLTDIFPFTQSIGYLDDTQYKATCTVIKSFLDKFGIAANRGTALTQYQKVLANLQQTYINATQSDSNAASINNAFDKAMALLGSTLVSNTNVRSNTDGATSDDASLNSVREDGARIARLHPTDESVLEQKQIFVRSIVVARVLEQKIASISKENNIGEKKGGSDQEERARKERADADERERAQKRLADLERELEQKRLADDEREREQKRLADLEREREQKRLADLERARLAKAAADNEREQKQLADEQERQAAERARLEQEKQQRDEETRKQEEKARHTLCGDYVQFGFTALNIGVRVFGEVIVPAKRAIGLVSALLVDPTKSSASPYNLYQDPSCRLDIHTANTTCPITAEFINCPANAYPPHEIATDFPLTINKYTSFSPITIPNAGGCATRHKPQSCSTYCSSEEQQGRLDLLAVPVSIVEGAAQAAWDAWTTVSPQTQAACIFGARILARTIRKGYELVREGLHDAKTSAQKTVKVLKGIGKTALVAALNVDLDRLPIDSKSHKVKCKDVLVQAVNGVNDCVQLAALVHHIGYASHVGENSDQLGTLLDPVAVRAADLQIKDATHQCHDAGGCVPEAMNDVAVQLPILQRAVGFNAVAAITGAVSIGLSEIPRALNEYRVLASSRGCCSTCGIFRNNSNSEEAILLGEKEASIPSDYGSTNNDRPATQMV